MVSIGVMFVTQAVVRIIIGPSDRRFFDGEKFIIKAGEFKEMTGLNEGWQLNLVRYNYICNTSIGFNFILVLK